MADSRLTLHTLTTYEIHVPGRLDASWADYIGADAIIQASDASEGPLTILTLRNADQSALIGLINALFSSGIPLLSVQHTPETRQADES
ncbi:MAG: hypothetical protein RMN52_07815 [Anaerolineae bacterium]|nr:hypothetical protein [Candidatus Roseilinea sp.]MDW8449894.1 hypothetical protein [Anaerolineae bacterium]